MDIVSSAQTSGMFSSCIKCHQGAKMFHFLPLPSTFVFSILFRITVTTTMTGTITIFVHCKHNKELSDEPSQSFAHEQ